MKWKTKLVAQLSDTLCTAAQEEFPGLTSEELYELLSRRNSPEGMNGSSKETLLTIADVSEALNLSKRQIINLLNSGNLTRIRLAGTRSVRISSLNLSDFIQKSKEEGGPM